MRAIIELDSGNPEMATSCTFMPKTILIYTFFKVEKEFFCSLFSFLIHVYLYYDEILYFKSVLNNLLETFEVLRLCKVLIRILNLNIKTLFYSLIQNSHFMIIFDRLFSLIKRLFEYYAGKYVLTSFFVPQD